MSHADSRLISNEHFKSSRISETFSIFLHKFYFKSHIHVLFVRMHHCTWTVLTYNLVPGSERKQLLLFFHYYNKQHLGRNKQRWDWECLRTDRHATLVNLVLKFFAMIASLTLGTWEQVGSWLAVLNAFRTISWTLFKLKHSWNTHQTLILLV